MLVSIYGVLEGVKVASSQRSVWFAAEDVPGKGDLASQRSVCITQVWYFGVLSYGF